MSNIQVVLKVNDVWTKNWNNFHQKVEESPITSKLFSLEVE